MDIEQKKEMRLKRHKSKLANKEGIMGIVFVWLAFAIISAMVGSKKGEGLLGFIVGLLFGPFGLLFVIFSKGNRKDCPFCKEPMNKDATVCPHCQREVGGASENAQKGSPKDGWSTRGL